MSEERDLSEDILSPFPKARQRVSQNILRGSAGKVVPLACYFNAL